MMKQEAIMQPMAPRALRAVQQKGMQIMSIIQFNPQQMAEIELFLDTLPELEGLAPAELEQMRNKVQSLIDRLDALEPKNENSEAYDDWADLHEDLEDVLDEILDMQDEE